MALARAEKTSQRFYSMSAQIRNERKDYYDVLEAAQRGDLDITSWMRWFLGCLSRAIEGADRVLDKVVQEAQLWRTLAESPVNERQRLMLNKLLNGFLGKLTTKKWALLAKCSHDTALRDIQDLVARGVLVQDPAGGRSTSYSLRIP
jgi:Fic family protein